MNYITKTLNISPDCSNFDQLPDITILVDARENYHSKKTITKKIILRPEDYIVDGFSIKKNYEKTGYFMNESQDFDCSAALMNIDVPAPRGPILVFGDYFLRKFYTVFDRDQRVVGIARANHDVIENEEDHSKKIHTPYDDNSKASTEAEAADIKSDIDILTNENKIDMEKDFSEASRLILNNDTIKNTELEKESSIDIKSDITDEVKNLPEFLEIEN